MYHVIRAVLVLLFIAVSPCVRADDSRLSVFVVSEANGEPIKGARLSVHRLSKEPTKRESRHGIVQIDEPSTGVIALLIDRGMKLPEGTAVVQLKPGRYAVEVDYPKHKAEQQIIEVDGKGEDIPCFFKLKPITTQSLRRIIVTVRGEPDSKHKGAPNRSTVDAVVSLSTENNLEGAKRTDAKGEVTWVIPDAVIGDTVNIQVSATGYQKLQQTLVMGSMQDNVVQSKVTNITATDRFVVTLKKIATPEAAPKLIVQLEDESGKPIAHAAVGIDYVEGHARSLGSSSTDSQGKSKAFSLTDQYASAEAPGFRRVTAVADGYRKAMSEVPTEYLKPGPPRLYLLRLSKAAVVSKTASFAGEWDTSVGRLGYAITLKLTQSGNRVSGTYIHSQGEGPLQGTMSGNMLKFTWTDKHGTFPGEFTLSSDGKSFSGWYDTVSLSHNSWRGKKK